MAYYGLMKKLQFTKSTLRALANKGMTSQLIAIELGCCRATVCNYAKFWGIPLPKGGGVRRKVRMPYESKRLLQKAYEQTPSVRKLGERWGVSGYAVQRWLVLFGIPRNNKRATSAQDWGKPWANKTLLKKEYGRLGSKALAKKWNCDPGTVTNWVRRHGLKVRPPTGEGVSYDQAYEGKKRWTGRRRPLYHRESEALKKEAGACQVLECGYSEHLKLLDIHHLDGDKLNNDKSNLVAACVLCHAKDTRGIWCLADQPRKPWPKKAR